MSTAEKGGGGGLVSGQYGSIVHKVDSPMYSSYKSYVPSRLHTINMYSWLFFIMQYNSSECMIIITYCNQNLQTWELVWEIKGIVCSWLQQ